MTIEAKTIVKWTYEPGNFFEEPKVVLHKKGKFNFSKGEITSEFDQSMFDIGLSFTDEANDIIYKMFAAQEINTLRTFKLSTPTMTKEYSDGRRDAVGTNIVATATTTAFKQHATVTDPQGSIILDTKKDQIKARERFIDNYSKLASEDPILERIHGNFHDALNETDNLLIHVYKIRDTLNKELGGEKNTKAILGVSASKWSKFGNITNNESIKQARHGSTEAQLRNLNANERSFVLKYTKELIEAYVQFRIEKKYYIN